MKNRFFARWTILGSLLLVAQILTAQGPIEIIGATTVCPGCYNYFVEGDISGSPQNVAYDWRIEGANGITMVSTEAEPTFCFQDVGTYLIIVFVSDATGNQYSTEIVVQVLPYFLVDIVSNNPAICSLDSLTNDPNDQFCEKVCPFSTVTYSVAVDSNFSGGISSVITWDVIGAQSYTVNAPFGNSITVTWGDAGSGSVIASAQSPANPAGQCFGEDALCVTIVEEPQADFSSTPAPGGTDTLQVCKGQTVYFENLSQYADEYEWFFSDDLSSSNVIDPAHTFFTPGFYTVSLVARSACFCVDTTEAVIEVLDAEAPTLDCVGDVCPGATVTYQASANCNNITWAVSPNGTILGGGTSSSDSITIEWGDGPTGLIALSNYSCVGLACPIPTQVEVPIIDDNAEIRGAERVCPDAEEVYAIEPFGGTGFVWTLNGGGTILDGQGTNRVSVRWNGFPNPNTTYWLTVQYDNCYLGCGGVDSIPVRIVSSFYINGPVEICQNTNGDYLSRLAYNNQNLDCNWTLQAPDGSVAWTSAAATATVNVPFSNGAGLYRLFAVPDDPSMSCSDDAEWAINVPDLPVAPTGISGASLICPGESFTYTATGSSPDASIRWEVLNGPAAPVISLGNPINVTWGPAGPYQLTAVELSSDGLGCASDPVLLNLQVLNTLLLNGPTATCADSKRTYTAPMIPGLTYQWSLLPANAGTIASGQGGNQVEVFWQTAGNHQLRLDVCGQTATQAVTVHSLPVPTITHPASLCPGAVATVQTSTAFAAYSWANASGGLLGNTPTIDLGPGDYVVTVTDSNGCDASESFGIIESPEPNLTVSTADPTAFCANSRTVTMRALVSSDGPLTYEWFRDGTSLGVNAVAYSTNQYGLYTVQATNADGCTATAGPISIVEDCGGGGGGGFPCTPRPPCPPGSVSLQIDPSSRCDSIHFGLSGPDFLVGSGSWAFVQSGASSIGVVSGDQTGFVFPEPGYFIVAAYAELTNGLLCRIIDSITVEAVAEFSVLPECPGSATAFEENSAFLPNSGITAWDWDFGDPASGANNTAAVRVPTHVYAPGGAYSVSLTITANSGCTSTAFASAAIPQPAPPIITAPVDFCADNALQFGATDSGITWDFDDPASGNLNTASGQNVYHSFTAGNYTVTATLEDNYGCTASSTHAVNIVPNSLSGQITPTNPMTICEGSSLVLTAPGGGLSYLWSDNSTADTLFVNQEGVYSVTLSDANGCTYAPSAISVDVAPGPDALIKALLTNDIGQVIGTSYPSHSVCAGEEVRLFASGQGLYNYTWSTGTTGTNEEFTEDRNNILSIGTHVFTVTVTDGTTGCTAVADPFIVTVNPVPTGFFVSNNNFPACSGTTNTLSYTGPNPGNWQYIWNNGETDLPLVTETPGLYFLRVINEFGCEVRSNPVTILPGPNVAAIPAGCHTRCNPDTLCLPPIPNIASWQWYYNGSALPGATSANFVATQSGTYYAELTDWYGCVAESGPLSVNLLDGYGNVLGQVWSDVNDNGIIDGPDTLVSGIAVDLLQSNTPIGSLWSGTNGDFAFTNILSTDYSVEVNAGLLPPGWQIVLGQVPANLSGCGAESQIGLLLRPVCLNIPTSTLQLSACPNDVAIYNSVPIPAGGSQVFMLTTPDGCDSIVTVNVGTLPTSTGTLAVSACSGTDYDYNGTMIPAGTSQQFTLQNYLGCDSVLTVNVGTLQTSSNTLNVSTCPGTDYDYNGTMIPAGSSQQFMLQNYLGCDSVLTVSVGTLQASTNTLNVSACPGTDYDYNGTMIPAGSSQQFMLQNYLGCDSVLTVSVGFLQTSSNTLNVGACPGTDYDYNGTMIPAGSSQQFILQNYLGCDSVLTVSVGTLPTSTNTLNVSACVGTGYDYNGTMIPAGSSQQFMLQNYLGCDSVLTVNVAPLSTSASTLQVALCPGDSIPYQGSILQIGDTQAFTLQNAAGCDSVVTVTVSAFQTSVDTLDMTVCPGSTYTFDGVEIFPGETIEFNYINAVGCDSTIFVVVGEFPDAFFDLTAAASCMNAGTGQIEIINQSGGIPPYRYSIDGTTFQNAFLFEDLMPGGYTVWLEDSNGCLFEEETFISTLAPLALELADALLPCDSGGVQLLPLVGGDMTNLSYQWSNGAQSPGITVYNPGTVWVEVENICETLYQEATVSWEDTDANQSFVYVPNVFAPLSFDPDNSQFRPHFAPGLRLLNYKMEVFDRWGNMMFQTEDTQEGWKGAFQGQNMRPGVYVWQMYVDIDYCGRVRSMQLEGDVTIVR